MRRRKILQSSVCLVGSLAGCTSIVSEFTQSADQSESESPPLYEIEIENWTEESHTVYLLVHHNDEIVHWATYDMEAARRRSDGYTFYDSQEVQSPTWPSCTGRFLIDVSMDERETWAQLDTAELDSSDYGSSGAVAVKVKISRDNGLEVLPGVTHYECEDTTSTNST